jgi:hypothetical protein
VPTTRIVFQDGQDLWVEQAVEQVAAALGDIYAKGGGFVRFPRKKQPAAMVNPANVLYLEALEESGGQAFRG